MGFFSRVVGALSRSFNYVASGEILDDAVTVAKKTGQTAKYAMNNPGHAFAVAVEGVEEGLGSVAGLAVGGIGDAFNAGVKGAGKLAGQDWQLYEGGFGTGIYSVNRFVTEGIDDIESMVGIEEPVIRNEYDRYILGATKGVTEVVASIAVVAGTAGAGAALIGTGSAGAAATGILAGSVNSVTAATITSAGTLYGIGSNINDQLEMRDAEVEMMEDMLPSLLEQAMPLPAPAP